jgi:hypothetical protein
VNFASLRAKERGPSPGVLSFCYLLLVFCDRQPLKKPLRDFIFFLWHYRRKEKRNKKETPKGDAVAFEKAPQNFPARCGAKLEVSAQIFQESRLSQRSGTDNACVVAELCYAKLSELRLVKQIVSVLLSSY